jgi:hypothetical protein
MGLSEPLQHFPQFVELFLERSANHNHVIQVHLAELAMPHMMASISCLAAAGALRGSSKGMTMNCHNPWAAENATFSLSSSYTDT